MQPAVFAPTLTKLRAGVVALGLLGLLSIAVSPAHAQSRARLPEVNQRLIRVENILDQSLLELLQQITKLEREVRSIRGEVEGQANALSQLRRQIRQQSGGGDIEQRLSDIELQLQAISTDPDDSQGTALLLPDPSDETAEARSAILQGDSDSASASEAETLAYQRGKQKLDDRNYEQAIAEFENFLTRYPSGAYADNAMYWQGEAMYAIRKFDDAIVNFNVLLDAFPKSSKVADAKLKIGFALYEQSRFRDARFTLQQVVAAYQGRSAAVLARQRLARMDADGQ